MDKMSRYKGLIIFLVSCGLLLFGAYSIVMPKYETLKEKEATVIKKEGELKVLNEKLRIVQNKIKKIKESILSAQKRVYSPVESDLGNETLFFTLYNDIIDMVHANKIKIRSIENVYNPKEDPFVKFGRDAYFVWDLNLELVSNYVDLGKLIQDLYQYSYYIKINSLEVNPYFKDKKVLISKLSLRLYTHTEPDDIITPKAVEKKANNATPQQAVKTQK